MVRSGRAWAAPNILCSHSYLASPLNWIPFLNWNTGDDAAFVSRVTITSRGNG